MRSYFILNPTPSLSISNWRGDTIHHSDHLLGTLRADLQPFLNSRAPDWLPSSSICNLFKLLLSFHIIPTYVWDCVCLGDGPDVCAHTFRRHSIYLYFHREPQCGYVCSFGYSLLSIKIHSHRACTTWKLHDSDMRAQKVACGATPQMLWGVRAVCLCLFLSETRRSRRE